AQIAVNLPYARREANHTLLIESIGHSERLRVIGNGTVFISKFPACRGHFFERCPAVRLPCVHMEIAADLSCADDLRKRPGFSGLDFATVLAEFRRNPRKPEGIVDSGFVLPGDPLATVQTKQPILVQR